MSDENPYRIATAKPEDEAQPIPEKAPLRPLSKAETAAVAATREFVYQNAREFVDTVKEFEKEGLIDGWRSVRAAPLTENQKQALSAGARIV